MSDANGLIEYIAASPSPFHCAEESIRRLRDAGFGQHKLEDPTLAIEPGDRGYVQVSGTVVAWHTGGQAPVDSGFRLLGAHTDSPNLRIKPNPEYTSEGYTQWGVEVYGGVLLSTWTDRDLGLCGIVSVRSNDTIEQRLLRIDKPIARIPNLAIHLNREVNDKGLILNKQEHLPPLVGLCQGNDVTSFQALISDELGCATKDIMGWDLSLFDVVPPCLGGIHDEFVFSPRLDNQASCYSALEALLSLSDTPDSTAVMVLFDHEECGSRSERGADSHLLRDILTRLTMNHSGGNNGGFGRAAALSYMVSADMAHGVHPNYTDRHDKHHKPLLNGGPVIKTNANMRYATNANTSAQFRQACETENVPYQEFINRTDLACGSTIGPISASMLSIPTVDVGNAMLSMHSIREQCGAADVDRMTRVMARILCGG